MTGPKEYARRCCVKRAHKSAYGGQRSRWMSRDPGFQANTVYIPCETKEVKVRVKLSCI